MYNKIFFASTSTRYNPIQSTKKRRAPVCCGITVIKITVVTAMAAVAAAGQWHAALVLVLALVPVPVPVQQPESMLKEQANRQA
jgi:hypothetical protein